MNSAPLETSASHLSKDYKQALSDLLSIPADAWDFSRQDYGPSVSRVEEYRMSARTSDDMFATSYVFTVRIDLLLATRLGAPTLEVFDSYHDWFKPTETLLSTFKGAEAETLFNVVRRANSPVVNLDDNE